MTKIIDALKTDFNQALKAELEESYQRNAELYSALLLAHGIATRVISMTNFDESQVSDWRPQVESALRIDSMLPNGSDVYGEIEYIPENTLYELSLSTRLCKVQLIRLDFDHKVDKVLFVIDANKLASLLESKLTRDSLSEKLLQLSYYVYSCDQQSVIKHLTELEYLDSETETSFIRHWNANKFPISTDEVDFALRIVTREDSISVYHDNVNVKLDGLSYKAEVNPEGGVTVDALIEASDWATRVGQDKSRLFRSQDELAEVKFNQMMSGEPKRSEEQDKKFAEDLERLNRFTVVKFTCAFNENYVLDVLVHDSAFPHIQAKLNHVLANTDQSTSQMYFIFRAAKLILEHSEIFYDESAALKKARYELESVPVEINEHFKQYILERNATFSGAKLIHLDNENVFHYSDFEFDSSGLALTDTSFGSIVALSPEDHKAAHDNEKKH